MTAFEQLVEQLDDQAGTWNDETYDLALARSLPYFDRAKYVTRLMSNAEQGDTRAILTLGHLPAIEALSMLQVAARSTESWAPTARRAVVLLGRGSEVLDKTADDALHAPAKMARVAAVMDLPKIGGAKAIATLEQAIADVDSSVRMIAWSGLVEALVLLPVMRSPDGKLLKGSYLELLKDYLASELPALVKMGVDEIRAIVKQLAAGASPASLGVAYAPDAAPDVSNAIMAAMVDEDAAYPVDAIAKLDGIPRHWAEASLVMRLENQDVRVPDALARLDAVWTLPVLEEAAKAPATPAALRDSLTRAVASLRQRGN